MRDEPLAPACAGCREKSGTCFPGPCKLYAERQKPMAKFTGPTCIWAFLSPAFTVDGHPRERTEEEMRYHLRMIAVDAYERYRISGGSDLHECVDMMIARIRPPLEACGIEMASRRLRDTAVTISAAPLGSRQTESQKQLGRTLVRVSDDLLAFAREHAETKDG